MATTRREFLKVAGAAATVGAVGFPAVARGQAKPGVPSDPVKIGVLAIRAGISTGVTLALGPVAEEMEVPWLSWDGTTQKGVEETMPNPKWAFRSVDNEVEAIVASQLTPKYFKGIKTVAGIGNDYSYGHDCWETYQAVLKRYIPDVKFALELFPKLGVTDFTSHIAAIQQAKPDLLMCSFWSGDATIIMKQAAAV